MFGAGRIWLIVGAIVAAGVIGLGWLVGAAPLFDQAKAADLQRADVEALNATQEAKLMRMKALDEDEIRDEYALLAQSVPLTTDLEGYFDWLAVTANASGVSLTVGAVTDAEEYELSSKALGGEGFSAQLAEKLGIISVSIQLGGSLEQITAFLSTIQNDGRLQLVTTVNMRLGSTLTTDLSGYIFVIDDPALARLATAQAESGDETAGDGTSDEETTDELIVDEETADESADEFTSE